MACRKKIVKRLASLCLILVMANSVSLTQTAKTPTTKRTTTGAVEKRRPSTDGMREHQLRVLREHVLARVLDNIKKMEEAGLRVSARNQVLTYLGSDKDPSDEKFALATQIARDALTDLRQHNEEIIPFMLSYLTNDLRSWVQKHRPSLFEEFDKTIKATVKLETAQHIRSLFELENGDILAAKRIRQELEDQGFLNGLNFWLDELMKRNSTEFEPVASEILRRAGQGQISFESLFWVSEIYLHPRTSNALKNRFLSTVVARTDPANFTVEPAPQMAYDLLTKILPFVEQFLPDLYDQALNQNVAIRASLSESQLAADARIKRLNESANPIEDLKSEAESAKSKAKRNELLLQAAQLALDKKKFEVCLDILGDIEVAAADQNTLQLYIDQFLKNFVKASLAGKAVDLAEKGAARIGSSLVRVEALNLIMRYYLKAGDKETAQKILLEASKIAGIGPDTTEKAKAFFLLSVVSGQVDGSRKADLLLSGVKALNNLPKPDNTPPDKTMYQTYVQRLDNSGYALTQGFQGLAKQDENSALALVDRLQKPDLKTFVLIGILVGLDELLTEKTNE